MSFLTGRLASLSLVALSLVTFATLAGGCASETAPADAALAGDENEADFSQEMIKSKTDAQVKAEI
jgi:hypothetical protein